MFRRKQNFEAPEEYLNDMQQFLNALASQNYKAALEFTEREVDPQSNPFDSLWIALSACTFLETKNFHQAETTLDKILLDDALDLLNKHERKYIYHFFFHKTKETNFPLPDKYGFISKGKYSLSKVQPMIKNLLIINYSRT